MPWQFTMHPYPGLWHLRVQTTSELSFQEFTKWISFAEIKIYPAIFLWKLYVHRDSIQIHRDFLSHPTEVSIGIIFQVINSNTEMARDPHLLGIRQRQLLIRFESHLWKNAEIWRGLSSNFSHNPQLKHKDCIYSTHIYWTRNLCCACTCG